MTATTAEQMEYWREEIAECIHAAAQTLRRMPDRERRLLHNSERGQAWPAMLHQACEHAAYKDAKLRLPPPNARQIDEMNKVLDWLFELALIDTGYFKVVWLTCAEKRGMSEVARIVGLHRGTVRAHRQAALTLLMVKIAPAIDAA